MNKNSFTYKSFIILILFSIFAFLEPTNYSGADELSILQKEKEKLEKKRKELEERKKIIELKKQIEAEKKQIEKAEKELETLSNPQKKTPAPKTYSKEGVYGFRSAFFDMTEQEVYSAIEKDFKLTKNEIEKTSNGLSIILNQLFENGGMAKIVYIFVGNSLNEVNIYWGDPINQNPNSEEIIVAANRLRKTFESKDYFNKGSMILNANVDQSSILVFRGSDYEKRMVILFLKNNAGPISEPGKLSLQLTYIKTPDSSKSTTSPSAFRLH